MTCESLRVRGTGTARNAEIRKKALKGIKCIKNKTLGMGQVRRGGWGSYKEALNTTTLYNTAKGNSTTQCREHIFLSLSLSSLFVSEKKRKREREKYCDLSNERSVREE